MLCASVLDDLPLGKGGRAVKDPDARKKEWLQFHLQASGGFVGLPNRLVDSKAFAALTTGASVQTLVWFWQMVEYPKGRKKRSEPVIGRIDKIANNGKLSFTYQEAGWRGMNARRFARALKDLFRLGFIDIARHGRGVRGEFTKFAISTRWQRYGTSDWQEITFPENFHEGFRKKSKKKIITDENVRYSTDENVRYEVGKRPHNGRKRPLKTPVSSIFQRTKTSVSIDLAMPTETPKGIVKTVLLPDSRSEGIAAPIQRDDAKQWRPPTSEIKENVIEILLQRPDPRASNSSYVRSIVKQLECLFPGTLSRQRVVIRERDLDDWTIDLMFTIAGANLIPMGATN